MDDEGPAHDLSADVEELGEDAFAEGGFFEDAGADFTEGCVLAGLLGDGHLGLGEEEEEGDDKNFSWVIKGKDGAVKNQGSCGSCWSFSVIAALESWYAIANGGEPLDLSEQ